MISKLWATTNNGRFKIMSLCPKTVNESMNLMRTSFFPHAPFPTCFGVSENPKAIDELVNIIANDHVQDGVSVVAVDTEKDKVVGVTVNKLMINNNKESSYYEKRIESCTEDCSKAYLQLLMEIINKTNVFEHHNTNCGFEISYGTVLPEYRKLHIQANMTQQSILLAKELSKGNNVRASIDGKQLNLTHKPTFVYSLNTTMLKSKLTVDTLFEGSYSDFNYNGVNFGDKVGHISKNFALQSFKL